MGDIKNGIQYNICFPDVLRAGDSTYYGVDYNNICNNTLYCYIGYIDFNEFGQAAQINWYDIREFGTFSNMSIDPLNPTKC